MKTITASITHTPRGLSVKGSWGQYKRHQPAKVPGFKDTKRADAKLKRFD